MVTLIFVFLANFVFAAAPQSDSGSGQQWQSLFDGKTLKNWEPTSFGGEGRVHVENGQLILETGSDLTGVTWAGGEIHRMDYEISVESMKLDGNDFFCGLTFPVGDSYCSLIVGGWAGSVVGISSIDALDASENETTRMKNFPKGRWYRIRVRVTQPKIEAWIDDEKMVDVVTTGHRLSVRAEVEPSKPLGIATWRTKAALRDIKVRRLK
ncbi:MAG TPA: DUF1080 domain-containing protein [Acidobacteriota bacterium]|nr:DUF1080 domain-containing protein [Acidobacteriota bacterium]